MMSDDNELVRAYATEKSEQAFATLVERHIGLVYSAALRQVGDPQLAEEVTQTVFMILASKAHSLSSRTILSGWLYRTTHFVSTATRRREARRRSREQEAHVQSTIDAADVAWERLSPVLDEAMAHLREADRNAIVLRYFQNKSLQEVGLALGVEERAAQKRVARSVERLRAFFARRGIATTSAIIEESVSANSSPTAPTGLASSVAAVAMSKVAAGSAPVLMSSALKLMAWQKIRIGVFAAAVILTTGLGFVAADLWESSRSSEIEGNWETVFDASLFEPLLKFKKVHSIIKVVKTNGILRATMDLPELGQKDFPVNQFSYVHGRMGVRLSTFCSFDGQLRSNATEIVGSVMGLGPSDPIVWKRTEHPTEVAEPLSESDCTPDERAPLQGKWAGGGDFMGYSFRMTLRVTQRPDGTFRAEVDTPDNGLSHIPIPLASADKSQVNLEAWGAGFRGQINSNATQIDGIVTLGIGSFPTVFTRWQQQAEPDFSTTGKNILPGNWNGDLKEKGLILPVTLNIARDPKGKLSATLDSPEQGLIGMRATVVQYRGSDIGIAWVWMGYVFQGRASGNKLTGVWEDNGTKIQLVLQRKPVSDQVRASK
jgi:RNA polymerase sigma factor (sigma-70 family)